MVFLILILCSYNLHKSYAMIPKTRHLKETGEWHLLYKSFLALKFTVIVGPKLYCGKNYIVYFVLRPV